MSSRFGMARRELTHVNDRAPELGAIVAATPARKGARQIIAGIPH